MQIDRGDRRRKMIRPTDPRALFLLLLAIQLEQFVPWWQGTVLVDARMEAQFEKCCGLGASWAMEGLGCEKFSGPVTGVPTVEQGLCLEAVDICCVRAYHERQCEKGKSDARAGLACVTGTKARRTGPGDYHRDCCEGCKLGILTGSMGQGCAFKKFTFGIPWDPAFLECCHEASPSTTPTFTSDLTNTASSSESTEISSSSSFSSSLTPSTSDQTTSDSDSTPNSPSIPTPPLDDICQLMKGLLCSDICVPTPGSYYCKCREGFILQEDGKTCTQDLPSDRCKQTNPCEQRCTDNGVAITCSCNPGYALADDKRSCIPKSSEKKTTVTDEESDFSALCPVGYRYNVTNQVCDDIDECAEGLDGCEGEICYNQPGGYSCSKPPAPITRKPSTTPLPASANQKCVDGTRFVRNRGCVDIDECREVEDACSSNEECVNTPGSYTCNCKSGFRRENLTQACVDINECQMQEDDCLPTQRCDNTIGSYTCTRFLPCGTGYTLNAATEICEDDDECLLGTHDCGGGYHCRNTLGSYRCDRNPRVPVAQPRIGAPTTTALTTTTASPATPSLTSQEPRNCPRGFDLGSGNKCIDVDECQRNPNPCGRTMQRCVNTIGSYKCVSRLICGSGYSLDTVSGQYCVDVDECADGSHECSPDQTCENRVGGYVCVCPPGHVNGPNKDCVDIDECSLYGNLCGSTSQCENTAGSYRCICESGFENAEGFGGACQDINECQRTPGLCQHTCLNIWGSYRCSCNAGFRLNPDNRSCTDIDECTEFKNNNLCIGICENTPGSYACKCPDGYKLSPDGRTCEDIDECKAGLVCRGSGEICHNTRGSFRCNTINCPSGYHRDHERKNRCVRTWPCRISDTACIRSPSHYSYNFITLVSLLPISSNRPEELFKMKGYHLPGSAIQFSMAFLEARAPPGVQRATESCFALRRPEPSQAVLVMTRSIPGPQEIELDLSMEVYHNTMFAGSAVAKILIFVSQYEF